VFVLCWRLSGRLPLLRMRLFQQPTEHDETGHRAAIAGNAIGCHEIRLRNPEKRQRSRKLASTGRRGQPLGVWALGTSSRREQAECPRLARSRLQTTLNISVSQSKAH